MMKLKVGEINPTITAKMGIDPSKLNKAQMKLEIAEKEKYKALYEELLKRGGHPVPHITDGSKIKKRYDELLQEYNKLKK